MDTENIYAGEQWEFVIRQAIEDSDFFLACLSSHSVSKRGHGQKEIKMALPSEERQRGIHLIPIRREACVVPDA
jgi:hypothetical protein